VTRKCIFCGIVVGAFPSGVEVIVENGPVKRAHTECLEEAIKAYKLSHEQPLFQMPAGDVE
jgi:hypothetical protein